MSDVSELRIQLEFPSKQPTLCAATPRNIGASFVGRNGEEVLIGTLKKISNWRIAWHP